MTRIWMAEDVNDHNLDGCRRQHDHNLTGHSNFCHIDVINIQILVILTSVNIQILVILTFLDSQILVILTFLDSSILVIDFFSQPNSGHVDVSRQPTITRISASEADLKLKKALAEFFTPFSMLRGSRSMIYQFFSDHGRVPLTTLLLRKPALCD